MGNLALIHTVTALPAVFQPLTARAMPSWSTFNIVDESLLQHTIRDGALSSQTTQRLASYIFSAVAAGADAIVVTCSTLGNAVDAIRPLLSVPLFRIDQGMAEEAVKMARHIGVLATLPTTLAPTGTVIRNAASAASRDCRITEHLCEGAFARLAAGDRAGHDRMVEDGFIALAAKVDLVVLAQASMAQALQALESKPVPFMSSPELGIAHVARQLASFHA